MATKTGSMVVGGLACQKNSFLKTLRTKVLSCEPHLGHLTSKDKQSGKKKKAPEELKYAVELEDTIIFPEGGGQPSDHGVIEVEDGDKVAVKEVIRDKLTALHLTDSPISPGSDVNLSIDWERRFDHMQQHTGQHLLSAIFDQYNLETLSWSLGETINYIELPKKVEENIIQEVQEKVNQVIVEALPITVETPDKNGHEIDTSNVPTDYDLSNGIFRVVKIGDIDYNPCCGTHLNDTSQIQSICILHQVNVRGGNSRLHFMCGKRVASYLSKTFGILKNVSGNILSCQVEEVFDKTKALYDNQRELSSQKTNLLKELASIEAKRAFENFKTKKVDWFYRKDSDPESINLFQKELLTLINNEKSDINFDNNTIVMFNGETNGMIKIMGPEASKIQEGIKDILSNVKGGGKGNSFQGKIPKYEKGEVSSLIRYLESLEI